MATEVNRAGENVLENQVASEQLEASKVSNTYLLSSMIPVSEKGTAIHLGPRAADLSL